VSHCQNSPNAYWGRVWDALKSEKGSLIRDPHRNRIGYGRKLYGRLRYATLRYPAVTVTVKRGSEGLTVRYNFTAIYGHYGRINFD
jgi:hypothetical protein